MLMIYALATRLSSSKSGTHPDHAGLLMVGYTEGLAADEIAGPLARRLKRCSL